MTKKERIDKIKLLTRQVGLMRFYSCSLKNGSLTIRSDFYDIDPDIIINSLEEYYIAASRILDTIYNDNYLNIVEGLWLSMITCLEGIIDLFREKFETIEDDIIWDAD